MKAPTSADVAREAGVSRATVSYTLNGTSSRIRAETRERVLEAAARLGYASNPVAKTLKLGYSHVVLLGIPPVPLGPPVAEMISVASRVIAETGYLPLFHLDQPGSQADIAQVCHEIQPFGLIAPSESFRSETAELVRGHGTRAVIAYGERPVAGVTTVLTSQETIGSCAARYLLERGHRDILGLMPVGDDLVDIGRLRSAGARAACREQRVRYRSVQTEIDTEAVAAALRRSIGSRRPSALFAFNDECALMAIRYLLETGLRVPDDVAVIGCDDSPLAGLLRPSLTSVHFDISGFSATLADVLRQQVSPEQPPAQTGETSMRVIPRESA
jgi:DNA-binding LacI/PurR family transcriptional regulator